MRAATWAAGRQIERLESVGRTGPRRPAKGPEAFRCLEDAVGRDFRKRSPCVREARRWCFSMTTGNRNRGQRIDMPQIFSTAAQPSGPANGSVTHECCGRISVGVPKWLSKVVEAARKRERKSSNRHAYKRQSGLPGESRRIARRLDIMTLRDTFTSSE